MPPPLAPDRPPYDELLDILASEWGIDASWDGLRGFWCVELNDEGMRIRDERETENAKLRELVDGLRYCAHEAHGMCARVPVGGKRPFTCCPLYDYDAKEYGCEKLMHELGIEVQ